MRARNTEKFKVKHANTERLKESSIPYMQRLLNSDERKNNEDKHEQKLRRPG